MNIYFAGSIRGGRDDKDLYVSIIKALQQYGTVLTEHVGDSDITGFGEVERTDVDIYERDMKWIREADVVVAEVSTPSLGVGYELGQAESMEKKILCLYRKQTGKRLSVMVSGNRRLHVYEYIGLDDIKAIFESELRTS